MYRQLYIYPTPVNPFPGGLLPDGKLLEAMGRFNEELVEAGIMVAGEGLHPTAKGARIRFAGGETTVAEGPFPDQEGLVADFWMLQAASREEAVAWMRRAPFGEGVVLELRQVFEAEDFAGADPDGALRAREAELRDRLERPQQGQG